MTSSRNFFCWIKVTPFNDTANDNDAEDESKSSARFVGGRPPGRDLPSMVCLSGVMNIDAGPRPPARFGGVMSSTWWLIDKDYPGVTASRTTIDHAPVPGDRAAATTWIASEQGLAWLKGASNYFLLCFAIASDGPDLSTWHDPMPANGATARSAACD